MISVAHEEVGQVEITCVTDKNSEHIRACAILPFDGTPFRGSNIEETPHLFEHSACNDADLPHLEYMELNGSLGGDNNATTTFEQAARVSFNITQPDNATDLVIRYLRNVLNPSLRPEDCEAQRQIVANELNLRISDSARRRDFQRQYDLGLTFKTDEIGLRSLGNISLEDIQNFQRTVTNARNLRIVLSGNTSIVKKILTELSPMVADLPDDGKKFYTDRRIKILPDYHQPADDMPPGITNYMYRQLTMDAIAGDFKRVDFSVIVAAFLDALNNGSNGIVMQSRHRGLSYGMPGSLNFDKEKIALLIGDTTRIENVRPEIDLLQERLKALRSYSETEYNIFARKQVGRMKINPEDMLSTAGDIESVIGDRSVAPDDIFTRRDYRRAIEGGVSTQLACATVQHLAESLLDFDNVGHTSYGENPFES